MKKYYILFFLVFMTWQFTAFAERINIPGLEIPKLIITEVRSDHESSAYVEITNIGDTPIDLEPFTLHSVHYNTRCTQYSESEITFNRANDAVDETIGKIYLKGILQPGESYVVANVWDHNDNRGSGTPYHNIAIAQLGDQFAHRNEELNELGWINKPEWQCYGKDSISAGKHEFLRGEREGNAGYLLHWVFETDSSTIDSTYIDQFNHFWYPEENTANGYNIAMKAYNVYPIAGVPDAMTTSVMVRKAYVSKGNLDWEQSRGSDASTSEWLVIPFNTSNNMAFTSVGVHGKYDLDYTVKDPSKIIVDDAAKSISIPWQTVRGDSLARYFNLGDGMAWSYERVGNFEDSASYVAKTGDKFSLYAVGDVLKQVDYTLVVRDAESDVALVFPKRKLSNDEEIVIDEETNIIDTIYTEYWPENFLYGLAQGPEIDSITNVSFATRTDSLLKYLDKPEKATWEFVFVDGQDRIDLKFGDKLKVTSENGANSKEYFISVNEHVMSDNALLSAVTWPDVNKNFYPRWSVGDTLPEFSPLKTSYIVQLRFDAVQIPAFQFKPQDLRSKVVVKNAIDIDGTIEQRTTSVTVTAESDTTTLTYNFIFEKQGIPVQPNIAEPFISEMVWNVATQGCALEIYNPGTEDLDLSQYMYVAGTTSQTWQEAVETCVSNDQYTSTDGIKIYQTHYVPSKRWAADGSLEAWSAIPDEENPYVGKGFLKDDNQVDPWVKGGDVWVMGVGTSGTNTAQIKIRQESDFIFRGSADDNTLFAWDSTKVLHRETPIWNDPRHNMWLLKVLNDSILDGTKDVRDASQYQLIDKIEIIGDTIAGREAKGKNWNLIRKANVNKGNLERMGGANSTPENSEWILRKGTDSGVGNDNMVANIGIHTMAPVTNYLSTVTSLVLKVTPGYSGDNLSITGNISDYTPISIADVLDKADDSQTFEFKRGETVLTEDQSLADADLLVVTSGDGKSVTIYKLINSPLNGDTSLIAKSGSGLAVEGNSVTGITVGMKLKDAISNLEVAATSYLNVLDVNGALQPLTMHNLDYLVYDVLVSDQIFLEVVAENNDKEMYRFDFGLASDEAILLSNILAIDQDKKLILEFPLNSTAPSMKSMVFTNEGATYKIIDKAGFERTQGFIYIDDVIEVTAPNGTTKVNYTFIDVADTTGTKVIRHNNDGASVLLYPNPVTNSINFRTVDFEIVSVRVYSNSGALMIHEQSLMSNRIDVSSLPAGVYIVKMTSDKGQIALDKFLKK